MAEPSTIHPPLALRPAEVAEQLGYSKAFVYKLIADRDLPSVRKGRAITVKYSDLVAFLDRHRTGADDAA